MQNLNDILENLGQGIDLNCVGVVDSGSSTSSILVCLIGKELNENTEVVIERNIENGIEKGIATVTGFGSRDTLLSQALKSETIHQASLGYLMGGLGEREAVMALAEVSSVIKKDYFDGSIEINGTFSNVPDKNTQVTVFTGTDEEVEKNTGKEIGFYGSKIYGDIPNVNYKKSRKSRNESRNSIFVGPPGAGKSIGIGQAIKQNSDTDAVIVVIDNKGVYKLNEVYGLDLAKESEKNGRKLIEICIDKIVQNPDKQTIESIARSFGIYETRNFPISISKEKLEVFTQSLFNDLDEIEFFTKDTLNSGEELEKVLRNYTDPDNTFFPDLYSGKGADKKKSLRESLDGTGYQKKKYFELFNKLRDCFFWSDGKITTKDLVEQMRNDTKATYLIHNIINVEDEIQGEEENLLRAFNGILKLTYNQVNSGKNPTDLIFVVDEAQEVFPKISGSTKDQPFEEKIKTNLYKNISHNGVKIMSKLRQKGVAFWLGFPSTTQINKEVLKLASSHERYIFTGLDLISEKEFFRNCSKEVLNHYEHGFSFPKEYSNGKPKSIDVLLVGQHSPYQPKGQGHFAKLVFPNPEEEVNREE